MSDSTVDDGLWLVVGLGNPGPDYAATRHNLGYRVVELLADRSRDGFKRHKRANADVAESRVAGVRAVLVRPRSYMNESGGPVAGVASFYKVPPERVVVVHDELDIPLGSIRTKLGGGDGGHNGLKSVRASLGSGEFVRVRLGIGRPPGRQDPRRLRPEAVPGLGPARGRPARRAGGGRGRVAAHGRSGAHPVGLQPLRRGPASISPRHDFRSGARVT